MIFPSNTSINHFALSTIFCSSSIFATICSCISRGGRGIYMISIFSTTPTK